jgi:hypothetical protein
LDKSIISGTCLLVCGVVLSLTSGCSELSSLLGSQSYHESNVANALEQCEIQGEKTPFPPVHRLNSDQYDQSIRDLLGTGRTYGKVFPEDQTQGGFKTDAKALVTSPLMIEHYLQAAQQLSEEYTNTLSSRCSARQNGGESRCYQDRLIDIAERAYRRPLMGDELQRLRDFGPLSSNGSRAPRESFQKALKGILLSPQFMFRVNAPIEGEKDLSGYKKASRLSYFIWGGAPDDNLRSKAQKGLLQNRDQVRAALGEMLQAERSDEFINRFTQQWLQTKNYDAVVSSGQVPIEVLQDMSLETAKYLGYFMRENVGIRKILSAKYTFASDRLADFYGIPRPSYPFGSIRLEGTGRSGLLTQGSLLTMTSNGQSASPVKRAKWILENIMCRPPGAPPNMVELENSEKNQSKSMRERLEHHRENPSCASCHNQLDPIGLAFEAFDHKGKYKTPEQLQSLDLSGQLPDGTAFESYGDLIAHLRLSQDFPNCLTTKIATFALGRTPDKVEQCKIEKIAQKVDEAGYGLRDLVLDIGVELLGR